MLHTRLNQARKEKGYTAQQMADKLHTGIRNYRKYESGDTNPTLERLVEIADILEVTTDYISFVVMVNKYFYKLKPHVEVWF